jgi:threonine dehydrogenase-like Zn-dependent dehydrogenase
MKAVAVFPKERAVRVIEDHPEPGACGPREVKLRMLEVGVCGTDKEICNFEYGEPPEGADYLVVGHESLGEVVEVGAEVERVRAGDLVVPSVRRPCDDAACVACRAGRQDFCYTGRFTERGIGKAHGFLAEVVADDERYMNVVPRELRDVAVLVEPLTIAEKALAQVWDIQERLPWATPARGAGGPNGLRAVVLGAGPVGLLGAMLLVQEGFETFVYSRSSKPNYKAELAERFGARYVAAEETTVEGLAETVGRIDLVYEAVGASRVSFDVLQVLGTNGVFVFTGVPGRKSPVEVDTDLLMRNLVLKNQAVLGTVNAGPDAFATAVVDLERFVARGPAEVRALITSRRPPEDYKELASGRAEGIKNVIAVGGS